MSFETYAGKMTSEEINQLLKVIDLYGTGKVLKAKRGRIPRTHKVTNLSDKSKGKWKEFLK